MISMCQQVTSSAWYRHTDSALKGNQPDIAVSCIERTQHIRISSATFFIVYPMVCAEKENIDHFWIVKCFFCGKEYSLPCSKRRINYELCITICFINDFPTQNEEYAEKEKKNQGTDTYNEQKDILFYE